MKAGPKAAVDDSPLPWQPRSTGSARSNGIRRPRSGDASDYSMKYQSHICLARGTSTVW